jgi:hypothetical protein
LVHSDLTEEEPKLEKVTKNKYIFVLNEAKNEQKSSKNSKRHLEDESEDEETDQK